MSSKDDSVLSKKFLRIPPVVSEPVCPAYPLKVRNVVSTAWVGQRVNLRLVQVALQARLDLAVFPSCVSTSRDPLTTNSIFDSGNILVTGASSKEMALLSCHRLVDKINRSLNWDLPLLNFKVQNVASSFATGFKINIDMFYDENSSSVENGTTTYDASLFRGCCWRDMDGLAYILFSSGKVVLTGAKSVQEAMAAYEKALPILAKYKLGQEYKVYDDSFKRTRPIDIAKKTVTAKRKAVK
jgi:TATA-box binding protein (TBP) (component of TFIID and TFIIIB)